MVNCVELCSTFYIMVGTKPHPTGSGILLKYCITAQGYHCLIILYFWITIGYPKTLFNYLEKVER